MLRPQGLLPSTCREKGTSSVHTEPVPFSMRTASKRSGYFLPIENRCATFLLPEQFLAGDLSTLNEGLELCPCNLGVDATTEAAVGRGDNLLRPDELREADDAVGDEARVLDGIDAVGDNARVDDGVFRQGVILPHAPLVSVPRRCTLEGVATSLDLKDLIGDIGERNIGRVRTVPRTPADMQSRQLTREILDGVVKRIDADLQPLLVIIERRLRVDLIPRLGEIRGIELNGKACLLYTSPSPRDS